MNTKRLALLIALLSLGQSSAYASVNVQTFRLSTSDRYLTTDQGMYLRGPYDSSPSEDDRWSLGVQYNYADHPLVEYDRTTGQRVDVPVQSIQTTLFSTTLKRNDYSITLQVPFHLANLASQGSELALGDTRIVGVVPIKSLQNEDEGFSIVPEMDLPTGSKSLLLSNGGLGLGAKAAYERKFGTVMAAANLGVLFYTAGEYRDIDYTRQIPWSLATLVPVTDKVSVNAELFQFHNMSAGSSQNPGELLIGSRVQLSPTVLGNAAVSFGGTDFQKSNDYRIQFGVKVDLSPSNGSKSESSRSESTQSESNTMDFSGNSDLGL
jgi:hypothetical protein